MSCRQHASFSHQTRPPCVDSNRDGCLIDRYRAHRNFEAIAPQSGATEKENNTIVEKWPLRLKRTQGQEGAKDEFIAMVGARWTGVERYMEWTRVVSGTAPGNEQKSR